MNTIPVYLVLGFLGSGKTTLLKRLVNAAGERDFVYLINEFSAVDVDAAQIEKEGGVVETLSGGSIFSRHLRLEFVAIMKKISAGVSRGDAVARPDAVVIEVSGMADPRNAGKLFSDSALDRNYHVAGVTVIVDPGVLTKLLLMLPNIRAQIQSADLIIFNKTDLHASEVIESVTERVRSINNRAEVVCCAHCDVDPAIILERSNHRHTQMNTDVSIPRR